MNYKLKTIFFVWTNLFTINCIAQSYSSVSNSFLVSINKDYQDNTLSEWKTVDFDNLLKAIPETFYKSFSIQNKYFIEKLNNSKFYTDVSVDSAINDLFITTVNDFLFQEEVFVKNQDSFKIHLLKGFAKNVWANYKKIEAYRKINKNDFLKLFKEAFIKSRKELSKSDEKKLLEGKDKIFTQTILLVILNYNKTFTRQFFNAVYKEISDLTFKDYTYKDYTHFISKKFHLLITTRGERGAADVTFLKNQKNTSVNGYKDPDMLARNYSIIDSLYKNWDLEKCSFFKRQNSDIKLKGNGYMHSRYVFDNFSSKTNTYYGVIKIYYNLIGIDCIITKIEFIPNNTKEKLMTTKDFREFKRSSTFGQNESPIQTTVDFIDFKKSLNFPPINFNYGDFYILYNLTPECKNYKAEIDSQVPHSN